ncbi:cytochrome P450 [Paenibacillus polysaccharolyticus]|uniref:cytochrome P450 n=1 Tax=Paenibacillus polysaccharolyticus TaxID=582692 RepID=UPI00209DA7E5|nr:cytochrome P450 [Paenibacillus polysaccharolyticus]MCP1133646.1 cytochrome P450 [Paenibacillus polysaccharolyticus]
MNSEQSSIVIHEISKLQTPEQLWNPYEWYHDMLVNNPIYYDEKQNVWNVFRYDDVNMVLSDFKLFSSIRKRSVSPIPPVITRVDINSTDPPIQRDIRKLVSSAFTPRSLKEWEPRIRSVAKELIVNMKQMNKPDIIRDLAVPLPVTVISDLLGTPRQDLHYIKDWSDILFFPNSEGNIMDQAEIKYRAMSEFNEYLLPIVKEKRQNPEQDIISDLTLASYEGTQLTDEEVVDFSLGLLAAGNETTTNLLGNMFYTFAYEQQGTYQEIISNRSLISNAIEETLRYRFPITLDRVLTMDSDVLGVPMKKGDVIVVWLGAANNDAEQFPEPNKFDIHRENSNKHLSFGKGPHFCLGAPLARLEAQIALECFVETFADIVPTETFNPGLHLHKGTQNLLTLPVELKILDKSTI